MKLGFLNLVHNYITLGTSMGLQMVDHDPFFKVTGVLTYFQYLEVST